MGAVVNKVFRDWNAASASFDQKKGTEVEVRWVRGPATML